MIVRAKRFIAFSVMALAAVVISLPVVSLAATSPTVAVLSPIANGLSTPVNIALDPSGNIYVADQQAGGGSVVRFDTYGNQLLPSINTGGVPRCLAVAQDGTLLVGIGAGVDRYNVATGEKVGSLDSGKLLKPAGIAVDDVTGYIYVADYDADQIVVFTASGNYSKSFAKGARGVAVVNPLGTVAMPSGITFEKVSRQLAVADTYNNRVQFFDVNGNCVRSIGTPLAASTTTITVDNLPQLGYFEAPVSTTFEYSNDQKTVNRIYVVDSPQGNVQAIAEATPTAFTTLSFIGSPGTANGTLMNPNAAVFDATNSRLMVMNSGNVTIYGIDGGKNPVYVDTTAPVFTVASLPATVKVNTITISGTVEAGSKVQVVAGGSAVVGTVVYDGTAWSVPVTALAAGSNSFSVTAKDTAGNTAVAKSVSVTYVTPAPALTVAAQPQLTNSSSLVITGTVDAGATVTVNGNAASVDGTSWSYKATLVEGANSFSVAAKQPLSDTATSAFSIKLDSVPPVLTVSALSDGSYTNTKVQNVQGTVSDANAVTVTVNGVEATVNNGAYSAAVTLTVVGENTVTVVATDQVNATTDIRKLYFDDKAPIITIDSTMDNSYTNDPTLQISGSVDDQSAKLTVNGKTVDVVNNEWTASIQLAPGPNTIQVSATDAYSNVSNEKRSVTLDTVKPSLAITSPSQDVAVTKFQTSLVITGTVKDISTVLLTATVNGSSVPFKVDSGSFTLSVDFVKEGSYQVVVTATDLAGNISTATRNLIYDITNPSLTVNPAVTGNIISGTVEDGATVVVKKANSAIGVMSINGTLWSCDITGVSYNTLKQFKIVATDKAGRKTTKSLK